MVGATIMYVLMQIKGSLLGDGETGTLPCRIKGRFTVLSQHGKSVNSRDNVLTESRTVEIVLMFMQQILPFSKMLDQEL